MIFWTIVKVAMKSLLANKLRSLLAMLGIIIGVWSVISALSLAAGAQKKVTDQMSSLGTNVVMTTPGQRGRGGVVTGSQQNLKVDDALAMLKIPLVARVAPTVRGSVQARYLDKNTRPSLLGTSPTYFAIREFVVEHGRAFSDDDVDRAARVAVIGPTTAKESLRQRYFVDLERIDPDQRRVLPRDRHSQSQGRPGLVQSRRSDHHPVHDGHEAGDRADVSQRSGRQFQGPDQAGRAPESHHAAPAKAAPSRFGCGKRF